ncbi:MICOS complex subunit MIC10-like protein [Drosera capensis]
MTENEAITAAAPPSAAAGEYDLSAKWDACIDLSLRRVVYSSLAGSFAGLLLFRSPVSRWATVALGAGIGIGSAYSDCSRLFEKPASCPPPPKVVEPQVSRSKVEDEIEIEELDEDCSGEREQCCVVNSVPA